MNVSDAAGTVERFVHVSERVADAVRANRPVVSLETAVATHGLPGPHNIQALRGMVDALETRGVVPAICAVDHGQLVVGIELDRVQDLSDDPQVEKLSVRDVGRAVALNRSGGLTVSATILASNLTGIEVFATGGVGGVHLGAQSSWDVSSDLQQLSRSRTVTVCAGAKSVLDIPRTLEVLETLGVPVLGFGTDDFPAFFLQSSGLKVASVCTASEVAAVARAHWSLGCSSSVVVGKPLGGPDAIPDEVWSQWLEDAIAASKRDKVTGQSVTPFLLDYIAQASQGKTVRANMTLLRNNAALAADIAIALRQ